MPSNALTIFAGLLWVCGVSSIDVTRKESGDILELVQCQKGTIVVNDDATHSIFCAKSMKEAGCDLQFSKSTNVGFIPSNTTSTTINQRILQIISPTGPICSFNEKPLLGPLFIQDYPRNIFKSVWTNVTGVNKVNETLKYIEVSNSKIEVESTKSWPGILLKLYIHCLDNKGRLRNFGSSRRCVLMKYEGRVDYPLTASTFDPTDRNTIATTSITNPKLGASQSEDNIILIYAIIVAAASFVVVLSICVTAYVICARRNKRKRHPAAENGNIGKSSTTHKDNHSVKQVVPPTPKKKYKKNPTDKVLVISPVISTDSRTYAGLNTFNIEPSSSQQTADVYIGESEEDVIDKSHPFENNEANKKLKTVSFAKSKSETRSRSRTRLKGLENVNFNDDEAVKSNKKFKKGKFKKDSSRKRLAAFDMNVNFKEAVEFSSPTNRSHTEDRSVIRQSPRDFYQEELQQNIASPTARHRPTYVEGRHPDSFIEDNDATSESIEAMFSFSNDMIEQDDDIEVEMEGDVGLGCMPTDFEENTTNVFPEDEDEIAGEDFYDNRESFNEHFDLNKRKENSLYSVRFLKRQNQGDMLMF